MATQSQGPQEPQLRLDEASPDQLQMLKQTLEQEVSGLQMTVQTTSSGLKRLKDQVDSLKGLTDVSDSSQAALVPLTPSLYVDGCLEPTSKVITDIGAGYFLEMEVSRAEEICKTRLNLLSKQNQVCAKNLADKQSSLQQVNQRVQRLSASQPEKSA